MNILYHVEQNGHIVVSNLPIEQIPTIQEMPDEIGSHENRKWKKETIGIDRWYYLCIDDKNTTRKIFNHYFDAFKLLGDALRRKFEELVQSDSGSIQRLQHNVNTYNAKIKDDLEALVSLEDVEVDDWSRVVGNVQNIVEANLKRTAITILKTYKNISLVNAEMNVYDLMQNAKGSLEQYNHSIHKIVKLSLQPFFLDFVEKGISLPWGECYEKIYVDFSSISVALGHFWNNAVKYAAPNTEINISFSSDIQNVFMVVEMNSLEITDDDMKSIFVEGYSGYWAIVQSKEGKGIGMYYIKKLMELNHGKFEILPGVRSFMLESVPYARNSFRFIFPKNSNI